MWFRHAHLSLLLSTLALAGCGRIVGTVEEGQEADGGHETGTSGSPATDTSTPPSETSESEDGDADTGETTEDDGGMGFVPESDSSLAEMCDHWDPEACPEDEKCTWYSTMGWSWDATKCVSIMGDDQPGDPCIAFGEEPGHSGEDTCAKGLCWDVDGDTAIGYCVNYCEGSPNDPFCQPGSVCAIYGNGFGFCVPLCDPLGNPNGCPNPANVCVSDPGGAGFVCVLDASGDSGAYGDECQYVNACDPGLFCANEDALPDCAGSEGCCTPFCDLMEPDTCPDQNLGMECVPWFEEPVMGYEHVGGCIIPE